VCETTLNSLTLQISNALNSNSTLVQKIPAIKKSYANLISQLKNIASTISSLKNRFGVNLARVPASRNLNNNDRQYVSVNKGKYIVHTTPPIIKMQSLLEKLRKLYAANKQLRTAQNRNITNAEMVRIQKLGTNKENADRLKSIANARNALMQIQGDLKTKSTNIRNLRKAVNKNAANPPVTQELKTFV
jgi:hypothetical protein